MNTLHRLASRVVFSGLPSVAHLVLKNLSEETPTENKGADVMNMKNPTAETTDFATIDGLTIYDLCPLSGDLLAVAGPAGLDPRTFDDNDLPADCRWLEPGEWSAACERAGK